MKTTLYNLSIFILFVSIVIASGADWMEKYPELGKCYLFGILTKNFQTDVENVTRYSTGFVSRTENIADTREVLKDANKSVFDLYSTLVETFLPPEQARLAMEYYMGKRRLSKVSDDFSEFDVHFCFNLLATQKMLMSVNWDKLEGLSGKEEVICEAAFFYGLIDFERAITCLDAVPPAAPFYCSVFSNFVADMYFGEASRLDFSYEDDVETRKWLDDMIKKYRGGNHPQTASWMRRFTRNTRGKVDNRLWKDYMRAMMTVHLSAALLWINVSGVKDLYDYIADNRISDEYIFASLSWIPLQPGQTERDSHAFLRTFKFDSSGETATMGIINSGEGIRLHDKIQFNLSELPDTISGDRNDVSVYRYIPFIVYDAVPRSAWLPAYTIPDSIDKAYFEGKQRKHTFDNYQRWQYIDDQRAGTCTAMSLWNALYWFERESQQKLESFRLALYLEVLREATKELIKLRTELEELDTQRLESVGDEQKWDELQSKIKEKSEEENDYLRFFSVGFNSAIRSIRYLHTDPFNQGLDMSAVMQKYADFYESQTSEKYWQLVKPNIDSLYNSTYLRILNPIYSLPSVTPKISTKERDCIDEVNRAIKARDPFNFVKAVISGTDLKCQNKSFLASIHFGVDGLDLQAHHQDLILRALAKEIRSLSGGRLSILKLVHKLINDYSYKLFPTYDIPSTESVDFTGNIYQVALLEDDMEMKQFAANCTAFDLLAKNVLAAAYDLVKSAKKTLTDRVKIEDTEEYKLHENLIEDAATELQSMDPHLYARYLSGLIRDAEQTGFSNYLKSFKLSTEWNQDDYVLLENAAKESGPFEIPINRYINYPCNLAAGRDLASKRSVSLPSDISNDEYVCAGGVSRAIGKNSPLDFVKAVASGAGDGCGSELFSSSIIYGIDALKLQSHHQSLILQALLRHENTPQMLTFIDRLVTEYGFKLFLMDDTLPEKETRYYGKDVFFPRVSKLRTDDDARQLAADVNENRSPVSIILKIYAKAGDLTKLRPHFVERVFKELGAMNPHPHAYHLSRLIRGSNLTAEELKSSGFKPLKEWNDYDYVLIESALIFDSRYTEYNKIFKFPERYHITVGNIRDGSNFKQMGISVPEETLRRCATLLPEKIVDNNRGWLSRLRGLVRKI